MRTHVIEVTDDEVKLVVDALRSYLYDFGHNEEAVHHAVKALLAKLPKP